MNDTIEPPLTTTQVLAEPMAAQFLWKAPRSLAIAVAVVKHFVDHDGPAYMHDIDLTFVADEDKNCIGPMMLTLRRQGLLKQTGNWLRSKKKDSHARIVFEYERGSYALCKAFLARNGMPVQEKQEQLL